MRRADWSEHDRKAAAMEGRSWEESDVEFTGDVETMPVVRDESDDSTESESDDSDEFIGVPDSIDPDI